MRKTPTLRHGTNFSHWLVPSAEELERLGNYDDFTRAAGYGADHIRLPMEYRLLQAETPPYALHSRGLACIDRAVEWARKAGLSIVLDLHTAPGMCFMTPDDNDIWTNPVQQQRFAGIWRGLAQRYASPAYDHVAFELLNEPTADDPTDWNRVARVGLEAVRAVDTERTVIIGSNSWNVPPTFADLEDFRDPHVVYAVHWYEPFIFTHQHAPWVPHLMLLDMVVDYPTQLPDLTAAAEKMPNEGAKEQTLLFSNVRLDAARMEAWIAPVLDFQKRANAQIYCSEFGAYEAAPMPSRVNWYRDVIDLFNRHNIWWANWDYRGDFGILDAAGNEQPFLRVLFPE